MNHHEKLFIFYPNKVSIRVRDLVLTYALPDVVIVFDKVREERNIIFLNNMLDSLV